MNNIDKIERRVRALLTQATDQAGTPEGDAFQARAFNLIARYGINEAALRPCDDTEIIGRTIELGGAYTPIQLQLAGAIGEALHCYVQGTGTGRKVSAFMVYGKARHVDRVVLLFSILNPQMVTAAGRLPAAFDVPRVVQKRSFMLGFVYGVSKRLRAAEESVTEEAGKAVAVLDDYAAAKAHAEQENGKGRAMRSRAARDRRYVSEGVSAADGVDLGQERIGGRIAITA